MLFKCLDLGVWCERKNTFVTVRVILLEVGGLFFTLISLAQRLWVQMCVCVCVCVCASVLQKYPLPVNPIQISPNDTHGVRFMFLVQC